MRILFSLLTISILLTLSGCEQKPSMSAMDQTASRILGGVISENENGVCAIDESSNAVGDVAFVTTNDDGSKMVLFRVWQGKGSNMRGFLYTNGAPLKLSLIHISEPTRPY